jgi:large subunit ribosomal protein L11
MQIKNIFDLDFSKIIRKVDLVVFAQSAKLGPPVGPILGQYKIKVKDFCTSFNESTLNFKVGLPLRVIVYIYKNDTFNYQIRPPSTTFLIKNIIKLNKKNIISLLDIYKITLIKKIELLYVSENIIFRNIVTLVKTMKIKIY